MDEEGIRLSQDDDILLAGDTRVDSSKPARKDNDDISRAVEFETLDDRVLLSADLIPIEGAIDLPGERDAYVFTLTERQNIFLDNIQADWRLRWTLENDQEVLVNNRRMPESEAREVDTPILSLGPGQYRLTVDAEGDFTGAYAFRLLNRANAETIELGKAYSPDLSTASRATLYTVDVEAGDRLLFDPRETGGSEYPYLTLIDPQGNKVDSWYFYQTATTDALTQTGNYTVIVEGDGVQPAQVSFRTTKVEDREEAISVGSIVSGSLANPGQTIRHEFTLTEAKQIYFETLANSALRWRLIGASGPIAGDFNFSNPNVSSTASRYSLSEGTYTIEVFGPASTVDSYAFRLRDLATATDLAIGTEIDVDIGDAGLSVAAGRSTTVPPVSDLPAGSHSHRSSGGVAPLEAVGPALDLTNFTLETWLNLEWSQPENALVLGQRYSNSTDYGYGLTTTGGGRVRFFLGQIGTLVSEPLPSQDWAHVAGTFDGTHMRLFINGVEVASLEKPVDATPYELPGYPFRIGGDSSSMGGHFRGLIDETRLWSRALTASEVAGGMGVSAAANADDLLAYWRFDSADGSQATDSAGDLDLTAQYRPGLETHIYKVNGAAGQTIYFDATSNGYYPTLRLLAPNGQQLAYSTYGGDPGRVTLPSDGEYFVLVEGTTLRADGGTIQLGLFDTAPTAGVNITLGGETEGAIEAPGQVVDHALTVSADGPVMIDVVPGDLPLRWTLLDATGRALASQNFNETSFINGWSNWDSIPFLTAGSYTLRVEASADQRAGYSLFVTRPDAVPLLSEGQTTASSDDGRMWLRRISASAGDVLSLTRGNGMNGNLLIGLFDATGGIIRRSEYADLDYTVRADGDYYVLVEPYYYVGGNLPIDLTLAVTSGTPVDPAGDAFALGDLVSGHLATTAERHQFNFTISEPKLVRFDVQTDSTSSYYDWIQIEAPTGAVVLDSRMRDLDMDQNGSDSEGGQLLILPGTYQVTIRTDMYWQEHDYQFQLIDVAASAEAIDIDEKVEGELADGRGISVYSFETNADGRVAIEVDEAASALYYQGTLQVIDERGRLVTTIANIRDVPPFELAAGRYFLMVAGQHDAAPKAFTFTLRQPGDGIAPMIPGEPVVVDLLAYEGPRTFTFDLATAGNFIFDMQSMSSALDGWLYFDLDGPNGPVVSDRNVRYDAEYFGGGDPILRLAAGSYRLTIRASSQGAPDGQVGFALLDIADSTALAVDGSTTATVARNDTVLLGMDLEAGGQYLARLALSGSSYSPYTRIIDPFGHQVFAGYYNSLAPFTAAFDGQYTLVVERSSYDPYGNIDVTASLIATAASTPDPLVLGDRITTTISQAYETRRFAFTLAQATDLYFDSETDISQLQWRLESTNGVVVDWRTFQSSNGPYLGGTSPVVAAAAGDYVLTIRGGSSVNTGTGTFSMRDVRAEAVAIELGSAVTATLGGDVQTRFYSFTAERLDTIYHELLSSTTSYLDSFRLIGPNNQTVAGPSTYFSRLGAVTLPQGGRYYLLVEGRQGLGAGTVATTFALHEAQGIVTPITVSGPNGPTGLFPVEGKLGNAIAFNGRDYLTSTVPLDLQANDLTVEMWMRPDRAQNTWQPLFLQEVGEQRGVSLWLRSDGAIYGSVRTASGEQGVETAAGAISFEQWNHIAVTVDRTEGRLRIIIDGVERATVAVNTAPGDWTGISKVWVGNDRAVGSNGSYNRYRGMIDELRVWTKARTAAEIAATRNIVVANNAAGLAHRFSMDDGTASLVVADAVGSVDLDKVLLSPTQSDAIVGRLPAPGSSLSYTFELATDGRLYLDNFTNDSALTVTIEGPSGLLVTRRLDNADGNGFGAGDPSFFAPAGHYRITVRDAGDDNPTFAFRILNLDDAPALVGFDEVQHGLLRPANATLLYSMTLTAGELVYVDWQSRYSASDGRLRLFDPTGAQVFSGNWSDIQLLQANLSGRYVLMVEGDDDVAVENRAIRFAVYKHAATIAETPLPGDPDASEPVREAGRNGGGSLALTGTDYLAIADAPALDIAGSLTVELWIKPDAFRTEWAPIINKDSDGRHGSFAMFLNANGTLWLGGTRANGSNYSMQTASNAITFGDWTHLAGVFDREAGTMRLYVNGVEVAMNTGIAANATDSILNDSDVRIGWNTRLDNGHRMFEGQIDDVRLWSVARSAAQVLAGMDGVAANAEGLVLDLRFTGTGASLLADSSVNALTANYVNLATDVVRGRVARPGEIDRYSFTLNAERLVRFDGFNENSNLLMRLVGPRGVVFDTELYVIDGRVNTSPLLLPAGEYHIEIYGRAETTGWYNFRMVDFEAAPTIKFGEAVTGTLPIGKRSVVYAFAADADDHIFFDATNGGREINWQIVDSFGNQIYLRYDNLADVPDIALPRSGTYYLLIEGHSWSDPPSTYGFVIYERATDQRTLTLNQPASGALATPGEIDEWSFTLDTPSRLVFDSLVDISNMNWSLIGPDGTLFAERRLDIADAQSYTQISPFSGITGVYDLLPPGNYTVRINSPSGATGAYSFKLVDLATGARRIGTGTLVGGELEFNGRASDALVFTGAARDVIQLVRGADSATQPYWRLIGPNGREVMNRTSIATSGLITLPDAGDYVLLIEGANNATTVQEYEFTIEVHSRPAAVGQTEQLFSGGGMPYVLENQRGPEAELVGGGPTGAFMRLATQDGQNTSNGIFFSRVTEGRLDTLDIGFDFRLSPNLALSGMAQGLGFALLPSSRYGDGGIAPLPGTEPNLAYALGVGFDINQGSGDGSANHVSLHFNGVELGEVVPAFALASANFNHARISLERTAGGAFVTVALTQQGGSEVVLFNRVFVGGLELNDSRLAFSGQTDSRTSHHDLDNVTVAATAAQAAAPSVTLDTEIAGNLSTGGAVERYQLVLTERTLIAFDSLTNNSNLRWSMSGPTGGFGVDAFTGANSFTGSDANSSTTMALEAGIYEFAVFGVNATVTGSFAFRLMDLHAGTPLTINAQTNGTFTPGRTSVAYTFEADAGDRFFLDYVTTNNGNMDWSLLTPNGAKVFNPRYFADDVGFVTMSTAGTYVLLVEGRISQSDAINYSFRLSEATRTVEPLTLGAVVQSSIAEPGETHVYEFTLTEAAQLLFDSLVHRSDITWTLAGPRGTVDGRAFHVSDAVNLNAAAVMAAPAGAYRLTVSGNGAATGAFGFVLMDLAEATTIELNDVVSGTIPRPAGTLTYQFNAQAGQEIFFDLQTVTGNYITSKIVDPFGGLVNRNTWNADPGRAVLPFTGIYTVIIEQHADQVGALNFTFAVNEVDPTPVALTLGTPVTSSLNPAGDVDQYSFTVSETTDIYVDLLTPWRSDLRWTLTGPGGQIDTRVFSSSDADQASTAPVYRLPAGTYTLRFTANNDIASDYSFAVLNLGDATDLTPGTPVQSTLGPGSSSEIYRFESEAGVRYFFDAIAQTNGPTWQLIGPRNQQIFANAFSDVEEQLIPESGVYHLIVAGRLYNSASTGDYRFNLYRNVERAPVRINTLEVVPGPDLVVTDLTVAAVGGGEIISGGDISVGWTLRNNGNLNASGIL